MTGFLLDVGLWFFVISGACTAGAIVGGIFANSGRDQEE